MHANVHTHTHMYSFPSIHNTFTLYNNIYTQIFKKEKSLCLRARTFECEKKKEGWNFEEKNTTIRCRDNTGRKLKRKVGMTERGRVSKKGLELVDRDRRTDIKRSSSFSPKRIDALDRKPCVHVHPGNNVSTRIPHSFDRCS